MLSEGIRREDDRIAESEAAKILPDRVHVAHHQRGEARGIEMPLHDARDLVARDAFDARYELCEIIVWKIVERELHDRARDLFGGLEAARVAARERGDAERELVGRDGPDAAHARDLRDRLVDRPRGTACLDTRLQHEGTRQPPELEGCSGPVG